MKIIPPNFGSLSHLPSPSKTMLNKQAMKDYVYFSDNTKGQTGKAVRIKIDLFPRFAALVDPSTHKGQTIIRKIENLRMVNGASAGVYSNANCAFRYMLQLSNMKVFYTVLDGPVGKEIFIGDIKADFERGNDKAGVYLYNTSFRRYKWYDQVGLDGKIVFINGLSSDLDDAARQARSRVETNNQNLALFYIPGSVINELGVWNTGYKSQVFKTAKEQFVNLMKFNRGNKVAWIAEAEGADMLSAALDDLSGNLAGHRYRLIDPLTNTPELLQKLKAKEVKPAGDEVAPVAYTGQNRATNMLLSAQKGAVISALKMLRVKGYAEDYHQSMVAELEKGGSKTTAEQNKRSLANVATLNHRTSLPKTRAPIADKAALSFVTALKQV